MRVPTNIVLRPGSTKYYARAAVPQALWGKPPFVTSTGKPVKELWKSLGTRDLAAARRNALPVLEGWQRDFERALLGELPTYELPDGSGTVPVVPPAYAMALIEKTIASRAAPKGESIKELYAKFSAWQIETGAATASTSATNATTISLLDQYISGRLDTSAHVAKITRGVVRGWQEALREWPARASNIKAFDGLPFSKVIEANKALETPKPPISAETRRNYFYALASFAGWLKSRDYLAEDVCAGLHEPAPKKKRKPRISFTTRQLTTLFTSPLYPTTRDHDFWLPLLGAFSGARLGELCQLATTDVRQIHGTWCMVITIETDPDAEDGDDLDDADDKSLKNGNSERIVPLHSELIRLGFLDYHAARVDAGDAKLFPGIKPAGKFGRISDRPSRDFGALLDKIGIKDKRITFHSLRHSWADALRTADYVDASFQCLIGHRSSGATSGYGVIASGALRDRVAMIESVAYPGLDLSGLYPPQLLKNLAKPSSGSN